MHWKEVHLKFLRIIEGKFGLFVIPIHITVRFSYEKSRRSEKINVNREVEVSESQICVCLSDTPRTPNPNFKSRPIDLYSSLRPRSATN